MDIYSPITKQERDRWGCRGKSTTETPPKHHQNTPKPPLDKTSTSALEVTPTSDLGRRLRQLSDNALASGTTTLSRKQIRRRIVEARTGDVGCSSLGAARLRAIQALADAWREAFSYHPTS